MSENTQPKSQSRSSSLVVVFGILFVVAMGGAIALMALSRPQATPKSIGDAAPAPPAADAPARSREFVAPPPAPRQ